MLDDTYIETFYKEICKKLGDNYKIVLEPKRKISKEWIEYDQVKWEIEDKMKDFIQDLKKEYNLSLEEKIMELYKFICLNYVYDANVLYFFKKDMTDLNNIKYIAVDWYGRIVGKEWTKNRQKHNRRICYEFSRFYAKAINELITSENKENEMEAVILGDKNNLHYVVALIGEDYNIILDQDDFNNIKDLTRVKLNLTIKGIHIIKDKKGKFSAIVNQYNKDKLDEIEEIEKAKNNLDLNKDIIKYLNTAINTLNTYNLDSQGFFEYIRSLIENEGIKIDKIWKVDKRDKYAEKRHERCLYFNYKNKTYLLDSIDKNLKIININNLDQNLFILNPEKNEYDYYGG